METKDENKINLEQKTSISSQKMKMQDFFGISNCNKPESILRNKSTKNEEADKETKKEEKEEKNNIQNKNNLYEFLYETTPTPEKEEETISNQIRTRKEIPDDNNSLKNNVNIDGGICLVESTNIFIDDFTKRYTELVIHNYECKFNFDEKVIDEFVNLVHFTQKYFEFPIFYAYKGKYDEETKITTITLKDYRSFRIFTNDNKIYKKLFEAVNNKVDFYRYAQFYKIIQEKKNINYEKDGWNIYDPLSEYRRQKVEFTDDKFCFSYLNEKYELCETYPSILVIPKKFDNKELFTIAKSRMKNRFPVLSYAYLMKKGIKSYMYRSAQIKKGGIIIKNKNYEVEYMNTITNMEKNTKGFIIFDCRPELNAKANALKGAGIEDITHYNNCKKLIFGCIENIHCVRKALKSALQKAYYGKENLPEGKISFDIKNSNMSNFLSKFESTKWLTYLSDLLIGSINVAMWLVKNVNVLVHCSDGWDRTAQVCSLVQIILDPYYRTIEGFAVLIEKEWVSFGHKFAERNGCENSDKKKEKERSPIFIQFLHAVHQITMQYPTAFEFNNHFLLFLCQEIYSNKYGTFLFNNEKEKFNYNATNSMISIWTDIFYNKNKYLNDLYQPINGSINVKGELKYLNIWNDFFFKYDKVGMAYLNKAIMDKEEYISKIQEEKNKSILELLNVIKDNGLENLIQDNKIYKIYKDNLKNNV